MSYNAMKLNSIRKNDLEKCLADIKKIKRIFKKYEKEQPRSIEEVALIQYIKTQNQKDTAEYMNEQGYNLKTNTCFKTKKYEVKEVSE